MVTESPTGLEIACRTKRDHSIVMKSVRYMRAAAHTAAARSPNLRRNRGDTLLMRGSMRHKPKCSAGAGAKIPRYSGCGQTQINGLVPCKSGHKVAGVVRPYPENTVDFIQNISLSVNKYNRLETLELAVCRCDPGGFKACQGSKIPADRIRSVSGRMRKALSVPGQGR